MNYIVRTPYNYQSRNIAGYNYGKLDVIDVDTSITENMFNSVDSSLNDKSNYVDGDEPVNLYGSSLTMTEYDPILNKYIKSQQQKHYVASDSQKVSSPDVASHQTQQVSNSQSVEPSNS